MHDVPGSSEPRALNPRAQLDHHVALCAFGGLVTGGIQAVVMMRDVHGLDLSVVTIGWSILGLLHGPLLWPILARRAWWTTAAVLCFGLVVAAVVAGVTRVPELIFLVPIAALWLSAGACWRFSKAIAAPGLCRMCDYDLRGLPSPRCPECGTPFDYADEREAYRMACLSPSSRSAGISPHSLNDTADAS